MAHLGKYKVSKTIAKKLQRGLAKIHPRSKKRGLRPALDAASDAAARKNP
jgi:hypothetical protein